MVLTPMEQVFQVFDFVFIVRCIVSILKTDVAKLFEKIIFDGEINSQQICFR